MIYLPTTGQYKAPKNIKAVSQKTVLGEVDTYKTVRSVEIIYKGKKTNVEKSPNEPNRAFTFIVKTAGVQVAALNFPEQDDLIPVKINIPNFVPGKIIQYEIINPALNLVISEINLDLEISRDNDE